MNPENSSPGAILKRMKKKRGLSIVLLCFVAAFAFKLGLLSLRMAYIDPDEGYYLLLARNLAAEGSYGFNGLPNIVFPPFLPFLAAAVHLLVSDLQLSLALITALSGALLGWIAFLTINNKDAPIFSLLAAVFVLFIPALNDFIPVSESYTKNLYRGSDILNALLIFSTAYFLIQAIRNNRFRYSILSGITLGLAYLTRPEAFLLFVLMTAWLLLLGILRFIPLSFKHAVLFFFTFLIVASPYIIYLRAVTGRWMLSAKVTASRNYRQSLMEVVKNDDWVPFTKFHYSLNREILQMNDVYWGYHSGLKADSGPSLPALMKNAVENFRLGWVIPLTIFPLYLWVFAIPGLVLGFKGILSRRSPRDAVLMAFFPFSLAILALSYPIPRHHLFLTPVLCIYAVSGIKWISSLVSKKLGGRGLLAEKLPLIAGSVVLLLFIHGHLANFNRSLLHNPQFRNVMAIDKNVSEYIKARGGGVVMSTHPRTAVWANTDWQVLPQASLAESLQFAKHKDTDYILWPTRDIKDNFYLLIKVKESYIPADPKESLALQILDRQAYFQVASVLPREEQDQGDSR